MAPETSNMIPVPNPEENTSMEQMQTSSSELSQSAVSQESKKAKSESIESVLHLADSTEDLSNLIKDNLEKEFFAEEPSEVSPETEDLSVDPSATDDSADWQPITPDVVDLPVEEEPAAVIENVPAEEETAATAAEMPAEEDFTAAAEDTPAEEETAATAADTPVEEEPEYFYVNVYEEVVRNMVIEHMEKLGVCTCNRCVADTTALTLTNLPSKYIITDFENTTPLINYYAHKYQFNIITELTKACLIVQEKPRHKK